MLSPLHEKLVDKVVKDHNALKSGARRAIGKILLDNLTRVYGGPDGPDEDYEHHPDWTTAQWAKDALDNDIPPIGIPDAYRVDEESKEFRVFEVEVSHRLSDAKISIYTDIAWYLDGIYWDFYLVIIDRFGNMSEMRLIDREMSA